LYLEGKTMKTESLTGIGDLQRAVAEQKTPTVKVLEMENAIQEKYEKALSDLKAGLITESEFSLVEAEFRDFKSGDRKVLNG